MYRPGCTEHFVLNQYRSNPDFIPELDFVMEEDGRLIGHVMFSKAELVLNDGSKKPSWTFGPISIHPDYKRKGYGLRLLRYALEEARKMGVGFLCMEGNIDFYKHAGFVLASTFHIHYSISPRMRKSRSSWPRNSSPAGSPPRESKRQPIAHPRGISWPMRIRKLSRHTTPLSPKKKSSACRGSLISKDYVINQRYGTEILPELRNAAHR